MLTDLALSVVTALAQCKAHLNDIREARQLAGALLFQILTSYLQVVVVWCGMIFVLSIVLYLCTFGTKFGICHRW